MRNRIHHVELYQVVGNEMEGPTGSTLWSFGTGNRRDMRFSRSIEYSGTSWARFIFEYLANRMVRVWMIFLAYVINRCSRDTKDVGDLLILLAIMRQEQGPCAGDVSRTFLTMSDIRGQKIIFVLG